MFLGLGTPLDQHFQVELLRCQPLQGVPADGAEAGLIDVVQEAVFKVGVAQVTGIVVAEHTLDLRCGQDLADDVEYRVVVQGIADFLEFLQEPLEDSTLNRIGGDEVEDQSSPCAARSGGCGPSAVPAGWDSRGCRS